MLLILLAVTSCSSQTQSDNVPHDFRTQVIDGELFYITSDSTINITRPFNSFTVLTKELLHFQFKLEAYFPIKGRILCGTLGYADTSIKWGFADSENTQPIIYSGLGSSPSVVIPLQLSSGNQDIIDLYFVLFSPVNHGLEFNVVVDSIYIEKY